jgi:hypothetical protein
MRSLETVDRKLRIAVRRGPDLAFLVGRGPAGHAEGGKHGWNHPPVLGPATVSAYIRIHVVEGFPGKRDCRNQPPEYQCPPRQGSSRACLRCSHKRIIYPRPEARAGLLRGLSVSTQRRDKRSRNHAILETRGGTMTHLVVQLVDFVDMPLELLCIACGQKGL